MRAIPTSLPDLAKSDRRIYIAASVTAALLALCAALLSYSALRHLAEESGVPYYLTFLFPITLDGLILSGALMVLFYAGRGKRSWGGVTLVIVGTVSSIAGNIAVSPDTPTARLVHAAAPITLFLGLEALSALLRTGRIEMMKAMKEESLQGTTQQSIATTETATRPPAWSAITTEVPVESRSQHEQGSSSPEPKADSSTENSERKAPTKATIPPTVTQQGTTAAPSASGATSKAKPRAGKPTVAQRVRGALETDPHATEEEVEVMIGVPEMDSNQKKHARRVMRREMAKLREEGTKTA